MQVTFTSSYRQRWRESWKTNKITVCVWPVSFLLLFGWLVFFVVAVLGCFGLSWVLFVSLNFNNILVMDISQKAILIYFSFCASLYVSLLETSWIFNVIKIFRKLILILIFMISKPGTQQIRNRSRSPERRRIRKQPSPQPEYQGSQGFLCIIQASATAHVYTGSRTTSPPQQLTPSCQDKHLDLPGKHWTWIVNLISFWGRAS